MKQKILMLLLIGILCTGCSVNYNLDISSEGLKETVTLKASSESENSEFIEYPFPLYYNSETNNEDPTIKLDNVEYYNSKLTEENGLKKLTYKHTFTKKLYTSSSAIYNAYDSIILRKYDSDEDGLDDYTLLSTSNDFSYFENNEMLEKVTINITCHYKIISHNADEVNGNTLTWNLTKDDLKGISLVYDDRKKETKIEKLIKNNTVLYFAIMIPLIIILLLLYRRFKKYSNSKNVIPD